MRTLIISSLLLILTLSVSAQQKNDRSDAFLEFSNEQYSLWHPKSWTIASHKFLNTDITDFSTLKNENVGGFGASVRVVIQPCNVKNPSLSDLGKEMEIVFTNMDDQIIESKLYSNAFPPYYFLKCRKRKDNVVLTTLHRLYLKNNVEYTVTFQVENDKAEENLLLAEKIFQSFRIH